MTGPRESPGAGTTATGAKQNFHPHISESRSFRQAKPRQIGEIAKAFWRGALDEVARQNEARRLMPKGEWKRNRARADTPDMSKPVLSLDGRWPVLERIEFASFHGTALRIDGLDLLRVYDFDLPFLLGDISQIVVPDVLVGRYIKAAFIAVGEVEPPIFVEAGHEK